MNYLKDLIKKKIKSIMKITYDQLETLKKELRDMRYEFSSNIELKKEAVQKYREKEIEVKNAERMYYLEAFNKTQRANREAAKVVFELEVINFDDVTNDGKINKNKLKKYPKFSELDYYSIIRDFTRNTYEVSYKRKWRLYLYKNGEQVRVESYEEFLSNNNVISKDLSLKQFEAIELKLKKAREKADIALKELSKINSEYYYLTCCDSNPLHQRSQTYYILETKF
jgi:hypothetical protein